MTQVQPLSNTLTNETLETTGLIHPTAIVYDGAVIGAGTSVGPYSIIGPSVVIGENCRIASHVVIEGDTKIGNNCEIFQFASIGSKPQDLKYSGGVSRLEIGNHNIIREYVTLQPGVEAAGGLTKIGNHNLFMVSSHVGHDSFIGDHNIFVNSVALAGHVTVGNYCTVGGLSGLHQFIKLGDYCFLGGGSMVTMDVPPFCLGQGDRAKLVKINDVGLLRRGFSPEDVKSLQRIFFKLFKGKGVFKDRLEVLRLEYADFAHAQTLFSFIDESERGVTQARRK